MNHRLHVLITTLLLGGCLGTAYAPDAAAQQPRDEVMAVIERMFDGMRAGDSTMVRSVFDPSARMISIGLRDGTPVLREGAADRFVKAVGTPHDQVWDERIWDVEVRVDGAMATVWAPYAFYLGDKFSHCGVNAFQLFKSSDGWKIINITDTRRQEGCNPPEDG